MLHLFTGLYDEWTHVEAYRVVVVGPSGHGKSGLLGSLGRAVAGKPGLPITSLRPTLGQSVVELPLPLPLPRALAAQIKAAAANSESGGWFGPRSRKPGKLKFWDLGASADLSTLWPRYYDDADCLVFVVDASVWGFLVPFRVATDGAASVQSSSAAEQTWTQLGSLYSSTGTVLVY